MLRGQKLPGGVEPVEPMVMAHPVHPLLCSTLCWWVKWSLTPQMVLLAETLQWKIQIHSENISLFLSK